MVLKVYIKRVKKHNYLESLRTVHMLLFPPLSAQILQGVGKLELGSTIILSIVDDRQHGLWLCEAHQSKRCLGHMVVSISSN